jgi:hypothetical protein
LSYIQSCVWGSIEYSGTRCGDYYLIPRRLTALIRWKILDSVVDVVSEALSMRVAPPTIQIVVVPAGVTVLLGLCNPSCSWISMVRPSLPSLTIAPCVDRGVVVHPLWLWHIPSLYLLFLLCVTSFQVWSTVWPKKNPLPGIESIFFFKS